MSEFFQLFQPGLRHQNEQRDLDKILVVDEDAGGTGPKPLDLDSGSVVLRPRTAYAPKMATPPTMVPDDKDWTWVLERRCPECGYLGSETDVTKLPELVLAATAPWAQVLARAGAHLRPQPQTWSALEYGCHVRDVLLVFAERAVLIGDQDDPEFEDWDQDAAAIADRYWEQEPSMVADEITTAAKVNASVWAEVSAEEWQRPGRRSNGSVFTLESLGRYFLHDLHHHLVDVGA
jgi:hypothetical protein